MIFVTVFFAAWQIIYFDKWGAKNMRNPFLGAFRKPFRKYPVFGCVIGLLVILLAFSLGSELFCNLSISERWAKDSSLVEAASMNFLAMVNTDAVQAVAEAVGLSSIPIACIYASLDQTELGFHYRELLEELYPYYDWFVVIHLVSVLCCLWTASAGLLEASLLSLAIILVGCLLQWNTLKNIPLSAEERRKIALSRWLRYIRENKDGELDYLKLMVLRMADSIDVSTDKSYLKVLEIFSHILCEFAAEWDKPGRAGGQQELVGQIQTIWRHLLARKEAHEQFLFSAEVLRQCAGDRNYDLICAGYVIYLCEDAVMDSGEDHGESTLLQVSNMIVQLEKREFPDSNSVTRLYLNTLNEQI